MALILVIRVVPSSGKQGWELDKTRVLKCYLKSPAERGLANQELIQLIAKAMKIMQRDVIILSGLSSRIKRVKIPISMSLDRALVLLGVEQQLSLLDKKPS